MAKKNRKILTVLMLEGLISSGDTDKIRMKTKFVAHHDDCRTSVHRTRGLSNFTVVRNEGWIDITWETEEGGPNISLHTENDEIDFIADDSDSDYLYRLYIKE